MHAGRRTSTDLPGAVVDALLRGKKIEAIKRLRAERGVGLKEASESVEQYVAADPALQARFEAMEAESRRGCMTYVGLILGLAAAVYIVVRARH